MYNIGVNKTEQRRKSIYDRPLSEKNKTKNLKLGALDTVTLKFKSKLLHR